MQVHRKEFSAEVVEFFYLYMLDKLYSSGKEKKNYFLSILIIVVNFHDGEKKNQSQKKITSHSGKMRS